MANDTASGALPHRALTENIIGGFFELASEQGHGFSERVTQRSLQIVLIDRGLQAAIDVPFHVDFRGHRVGRFLADMVVNGLILVEIKTMTALDAYAEAQILNYLKCAGGGIGLLVNFGRRVEFKRFVVGDPVNSLPALRASTNRRG